MKEKMLKNHEEMSWLGCGSYVEVNAFTLLALLFEQV